MDLHKEHTISGPAAIGQRCLFGSEDELDAVLNLACLDPWNDKSDAASKY